MKVLVLWADPSSANLGVRVLAEGLARLARHAWGEQTQVDFQDFGPDGARPGFGGRSILRDFGRRNGPIASRLRDYDVILDSGAGDSFADIYGVKRLAIMVFAQRRALRAGIPLVLAPQTIGPFRRRLSRLLASRTLRSATVVFARDRASLEVARAARAEAAAATDVVFALPAPPRASQRDVIVNVSGLLWNGHGDVDPVKYRADIERLIVELDGAGRRVAVLAHVLDNATHDNDVLAVREVAQAFPFVEVLIPQDLTEARAMIASARVLVGARMHACLNALSVGVPALAWAYSRKFEPLMRDIGWPHVIDVRSADLASESIAQLDEIAADARIDELAQATTESLARTVERLRACVATERLIEEGRLS